MSSYRLGCGHYTSDEPGTPGDICPECTDLGDSPDPWLVAGEDINLDRLAETRSYRQARRRGA